MNNATFPKKIVQKKVMIPVIIGVGILLHSSIATREFMGTTVNATKGNE
jgi:hypothetical protein